MATEVKNKFNGVNFEEEKPRSFFDNPPEDEKIKEIAEPLLLSSSYSTLFGVGIGGSAGGPIGAVVGGVIGSILGVSTGVTVCTLLYYEAYEAWLKENCGQMREEIFKEIADHEELEKYLCPISFDFFKNPVKTPTGHIYDYDSITNPELIDEKGMIKDPLRNPSFSIDDLEEVPELQIEMLTAIVSVLNSEIEGEQVSEKVREGLEAFVEGLKIDIKERKRFKDEQEASKLAAENISKSSCQIM